MIYLCHLFTVVGLVVFQTAVVCHLGFMGGIYDLLLPYIVCTGLFRPLHEGLVIAFLGGFLMDSLSGGPMGLYATVYFWLLLGVRWLIGFLHRGNLGLIFAALSAGVVMQNVIFICMGILLPARGASGVITLRTVGMQLLWAVLSGPVLMAVFYHIHRLCQLWLERRRGDKDAYEVH